MREKNSNSTKREAEPDRPEKQNYFSHFARTMAAASGSPWAFLLACLIIVVWLVTGPIFNYSDTWQLIINTGTTIVTFLMVFIIQHTQNRDTIAMQLKLDELIRATKGAHNVVMDLEDLSDKELQKVYQDYMKLAQDARTRLREGGEDTGQPDIKDVLKP